MWNWIQANGTKILGYAQGTIAALCGVAGLIPDSSMKYWLGAFAVLTVWRGQANTTAIAQAVADKHLATIADSQTSTVIQTTKVSVPKEELKP